MIPMTWSATLAASLVACLHGASSLSGSRSRAIREVPWNIRETAAVNPTELRCEYLDEPLGIDEPHPRLSWIVSSTKRGADQSAYRVLVASTAERLAQDDADLWDSGKVPSSRAVGIVYAGKPLASRQQGHWKVMAWDNEGTPGPWSEPATWEMGLLAPSDWVAQWVNADAKPVADLLIDSAAYFTEDGKVRVDVTDAVRRLVREGKPIVASNASMGGDPAFGVKKRLTVEYRVGGPLGVAMRAEAAENATAMLNASRMPYLRRTFTVNKPVRHARLYSTALGVYDAYLNGQPTSANALAPGWTDYCQRVQYQTVDVTDKLVPGENVLGAIVAPGWFSGRAGLFHARAFYGDTPALLAQLEMTFADGSMQIIATDHQWKRHDGPLIAADIMDGEVYDAHLAINHWCEKTTSDRDWAAVTTRKEVRRLEAQPDLPVRMLSVVDAVSANEVQSGRWVFDLGQNIVGVPSIRVREKAGTVITLRHAEMLNPDGTLYLANLRGAAATDTYVCRGDANGETWEPRFTFHGFRYVEMSGLTTPPDKDAVRGVVLGSELPETGEFECSDPRLNQLYSNIVWGLRGNYLSIPTDCPQRDERMGWMGDAQAFIGTAAMVANVAPFMTKWMRDVRDAQREDGAHSDVAPVMKGLDYGTPAWADAGAIVPRAMYQAYGDQRALEQNIDSMTRWVEWCRAHSNDLIREKHRGNDYGDWLSIDADTPKDLIGTAFFARSTALLAEAYAALGRGAEANRYRELFAQIRDAFANRFIAADGTVTGKTQTGYLLTLGFNLVPETGPVKPEMLEAHLLADLKARNWRLSTGFIGVGLLLPVLDDVGHPDAAYRLLMQDEFPSWLFSVKHGATTIWERWNGWTPDGGMNDPGMNSFNHYALGSCGAWLFSGVGGIRADTPGFERITIKPRIGGGLTWAKTTFQSVRGRIATHWDVQGDQLHLTVEVPANSTARVWIPTRDPASVRESGQPIAQAHGIVLIGHEPDALVVRVGGGRYVFTAAQ